MNKMWEENDYHLHNIILNGVAVSGEDCYYGDLNNRSKKRYKRFNFLYENNLYSTHQENRLETPYLYKDNCLYYEQDILDEIPFERISDNRGEWGSESSWYFKYSSNNENYYELRLNPINVCANVRFKTGPEKEFNGCAFCHRVYDSSRHSEKRMLYSVESIFSDIIKHHGKDVFMKIGKVLMITGDAKTSGDLLNIVENINYNYLKPNGFNGVFSLATAQLKSYDEIKRLAHIDSTIFEYPLEAFTRREMLLGPEKGIPFSEVLNVLRTAKIFFSKIRLNYVVGLESIETMRDGFTKLVEEGLVDDVIANIMTPFTPEMKSLRIQEASTPEYILEARALFQELNIYPKRGGVSKNLFNELEFNFAIDLLTVK